MNKDTINTTIEQDINILASDDKTLHDFKDVLVHFENFIDARISILDTNFEKETFNTIEQKSALFVSMIEDIKEKHEDISKICDDLYDIYNEVLIIIENKIYYKGFIDGSLIFKKYS